MELQMALMMGLKYGKPNGVHARPSIDIVRNNNVGLPMSVTWLLATKMALINKEMNRQYNAILEESNVRTTSSKRKLDNDLTDL